MSNNDSEFLSLVQTMQDQQVDNSTIIARGIDVSKYQGTIDWATVKANIDYALIRVGFGGNATSQDDPYFAANLAGVKEHNIPFGVYLFSYATTVEKAKSEAEHVLRLINGEKLSYPVYLDMESAEYQQNLGATLLGDIATTFCEKIKAAGFYPGVYANKNWFTNYLTDPRFNNYDKWVAQYSDTCTYEGTYTMWQYSSKGTVPGISGNVDMNYCYVDYPAIINGTTPPSPEPEPEPDPGPKPEPDPEPTEPDYKDGAMNKKNIPYKEKQVAVGQMFTHDVNSSCFGNYFSGNDISFGLISDQRSSKLK